MIKVIKACLAWPIGHCSEPRVKGTDLCQSHILKGKLKENESV
jgi:hypothetical protein